MKSIAASSPDMIVSTSLHPKQKRQHITNTFYLTKRNTIGELLIPSRKNNKIYDLIACTQSHHTSN